MPVILQTILGVIGSTLLQMGIKAISGDMVKFLVIKILEIGVAKYERRAWATPEASDDVVAQSLSEGLEKLKEIWAKD